MLHVFTDCYAVTNQFQLLIMLDCYFIKHKITNT